MNKRYSLAVATVLSTVSLGLVTGCTPAVQGISAGSETATKVIQKSVSWTRLEAAIAKSDGATMYKVKTNVTLQDGSMHTNYSLYGAVNLPNSISVQVHENNFNISFYQQGQVAYTDELGTWMQSSPVSNIDAYGGYQTLIQNGADKNVQLQQLNRTYVDNEYCDVYRATLPATELPLPSFLQAANTGVGSSDSLRSADEGGIQYTFYVGQTSGYVREIQTQDINTVNELGPVATATDSVFFDIDDVKIAKISVPQTLVKQLENKG